MQVLEDSVPRYVRCIKPNANKNGDVSDFDSDLVMGQLRAGSILEAVKIRKVGYGYRMEYDEFIEKFWPILGERIFESDNETPKLVFAKAAEMAEGAHKQILLEGTDQGWQCGRTKLCMKDEAKLAIEAVLK